MFKTAVHLVVFLTSVQVIGGRSKQGRFVFNFAAPSSATSPFACALGFRDPGCFTVPGGCNLNDPWCLIAERSKKWPFNNPLDQPACYLGSTDPRCPPFGTISTSTTTIATPQPLFSGNTVTCYPGSQHPRCQQSFRVYTSSSETTTSYTPPDPFQKKFTGPAFCYPGAPDIRCREKIHIPHVLPTSASKSPEATKTVSSNSTLNDFKEVNCSSSMCAQKSNNTELLIQSTATISNCTCTDLLKNNFTLCTSSECKFRNTTCLLGQLNTSACLPKILISNITLPISKLICLDSNNSFCLNNTLLNKIVSSSKCMHENCSTTSASASGNATVKITRINSKNKSPLLNMTVNANTTRNYTTNERSRCSSSTNNTHCLIIVGNCKGLNSSECAAKKDDLLTVHSAQNVTTSFATDRNQTRKMSRRDDMGNINNITLTTNVNITTPISANGKVLTLHDGNNAANGTVLIDLLPKIGSGSKIKT